MKLVKYYLEGGAALSFPFISFTCWQQHNQKKTRNQCNSLGVKSGSVAVFDLHILVEFLLGQLGSTL